MEKQLKQIQNWKTLYENETLDSSLFNSEFRLSSFYNSFFQKPTPSLFGICFESFNPFGFNHLNYYTILYSVKSFYDLFLSNASNLNIALYFDEQIPEFIIKKVISFLNLKKCNVFILDSAEVSVNVVKSLNFYPQDMNFLVFEKENNTDKFYLNIFKNTTSLSINGQQKVIDYMLNDQEFITFGTDEVPTYLNLEKLLILNKGKQLQLGINKYFDYSEFKGLILVEDNRDYLYLDNLIKNTQINFKVVHNNYLFGYFSNSKRNFFQSFFIENFVTVEVIFLVSKDNQLKVLIKQKNNFILLKNYEVAFLFIDKEVYKWKNNLQNEVLVPLQNPLVLKQMIQSYNFIEAKIDSYKSGSNTIFGYYNDFYICKYNNILRFSNILMMFLLIQTFVQYRQNNNLLNYKFLKMKSRFGQYLYQSSTIKINPVHKDLIRKDFLLKDEQINKHFAIDKLKIINFEIQNKDYLLEIKSHYSKTKKTFTAKWIVSFDQKSAQLSLWGEFHSNKKLTLWTKRKFYLLHRKMLKKFKTLKI